jgi:hypothetical protein
MGEKQFAAHRSILEIQMVNPAVLIGNLGTDRYTVFNLLDQQLVISVKDPFPLTRTRSNKRQMP